MTTETLPITLRVDRESAWLYEGAIASSPYLAWKFKVEIRPPSPAELRGGAALAAWESYRNPDADFHASTMTIDPETAEWLAIRAGAETLRKIRSYLRETGQDDPQRVYWREAQRRHRAMLRG